MADVVINNPTALLDAYLNNNRVKLPDGTDITNAVKSGLARARRAKSDEADTLRGEIDALKVDATGKLKIDDGLKKTLGDLYDYSKKFSRASAGALGAARPVNPDVQKETDRRKGLSDYDAGTEALQAYRDRITAHRSILQDIYGEHAKEIVDNIDSLIGADNPEKRKQIEAYGKRFKENISGKSASDLPTYLRSYMENDLATGYTEARRQREEKNRQESKAAAAIEEAKRAQAFRATRSATYHSDRAAAEYGPYGSGSASTYYRSKEFKDDMAAKEAEFRKTFDEMDRRNPSRSAAVNHALRLEMTLGADQRGRAFSGPTPTEAERKRFMDFREQAQIKMGVMTDSDKAEWKKFSKEWSPDEIKRNINGFREASMQFLQANQNSRFHSEFVRRIDHSINMAEQMSMPVDEWAKRANNGQNDFALNQTEALNLAAMRRLNRELSHPQHPVQIAAVQKFFDDNFLLPHSLDLQKKSIEVWIMMRNLGKWLTPDNFAKLSDSAQDKARGAFTNMPRPKKAL